MAFRYPPEVGLRNLARLYRSSTKINPSSGRRGYRAAVCSEFGKPLEIVNRERPQLEHNEVRVGVKRAALNFGDILLVQGKYQDRPPLPFVPGYELTGEVLEVGSNVQQLKPGDNVITIPLTRGAFAEEIVAPEMTCYPIGKHFNLDESVAFLTSYGTAEMALARTVKLKETDTILITAAAGALGLAAVDLAANLYKATVIGACGGADKCQIVSKYGAKFTIDYKKENLRERIQEITKGRGVDIVLDVVGGKVLEDGLRCLAFEGKLLTLGYASGQIPKIPANILLVKNISVHGLFWGSYGQRNPEVFFQSVNTVIKLWQEGKIKPLVGKVFPLSQINEAMEYVADRQSAGKVILDCTKA